MTAAETVADLIKSGSIVIFSKSTCPYCREVLQLFKKLDVSVRVVELTKYPDAAKIQSALMAKTGIRTVPQVFIGGRFVGDCSETKKKHKSGELAVILHSVKPAEVQTSA